VSSSHEFSRHPSDRTGVSREYHDGRIVRASNARIGRYRYFPRQIADHYRGNLPNRLSIVDVGCGGAAEHPLLVDYFEKRDVHITLVGVDVNGKLLRLSKEGLVSYPLEIDLLLDRSNGKISVDRCMASYPDRKKVSFPRSIYDYFVEAGYNRRRYRRILHIDESINLESGRWSMRPEWRKRLNLVCADATCLPFDDGIADVVIAENFFMGSDEGVYHRIRLEMGRILKPNGLFLGD